MPIGIEAWVTQIPPITRAWLVISILTSLAVVRLSCIAATRRCITDTPTAMPDRDTVAALFQLQVRFH
jgi:hypothetical protein